MEALIGVLICLGVLVVASLLLAFVVHDSLVEAKKTLLALAIFLASACAYVLHFGPDFGEALQVLVGGALAVVGVFAAPQFSVQDLSKAITAATGGIFSVLQFLGINNPSVETEVYTLIGLGIAVFGIWWTNNSGHLTKLPARR